MQLLRTSTRLESHSVPWLPSPATTSMTTKYSGDYKHSFFAYWGHVHLLLQKYSLIRFTRKWSESNVKATRFILISRKWKVQIFKLKQQQNWKIIKKKFEFGSQHRTSFISITQDTIRFPKYWHLEHLFAHHLKFQLS